jgi:hypothetical protein
MRMNEKMSAVAGVCLILLQAACGGAGGPAAPTAASPVPSPTPTALGPIAPALVGTWTGTLSGSFGPGDLVMNLNADGTMWFEGTGRYCRVDGSWGVSGTQFSASGGDCTGTVVTKVAPASSANLTGTWSASSGRSGTFSVTKR